MRRYFAEFIGTFMLVLVITGTLMVDKILHTSTGNVPPVVFLAVLSLVYTIGPVSGCNINPAVTIGIYLLGKMRGRDVVPYILAQLAGAAAASLILLAVLGNVDHLGATIAHPGWTGLRGAEIEALLTFGLQLAVAMTFHENFQPLSSGVAVAAALAVGAYWGAPLSGGSINPARSFGPALVTGNFTDFWIYIAGPLAGAILATLVGRYLLAPTEGMQARARKPVGQTARGPKLLSSAR